MIGAYHCRSSSKRLAVVMVMVTLLPIASCSTTSTFIEPREREWRNVAAPPDDSENYRIILVGDAGAAATDGTDPVLNALRVHLEEAGQDGAIIFLGDNIYCCGLPDSSAAARKGAEARLRAELETVKDFKGRIMFVPGNHDWNKSRPGGLESVKRQERFVESFLSRGNTFLPDGGFPGPEKVRLNDDITVLAIDTEWWLTDQQKSFGEDGKKDIREPGDFLLELREDVVDEDDKFLLVVGHHPLYSNGPHGGRFSLREHVFPLTALWDRAFVPLPLIGSLPFLYVRYLGASEQDLAHRRYRELRAALERIFSEHENLIYAAGHEHSLQYFRIGSNIHPQHHIISGSASKSTHVAGGHGAVFAAEGRGFVTLHYYDDGSVWSRFWRIDGAEGVQLAFRTRISAPRLAVKRGEIENTAAEVPAPLNTADSTVTVAANPSYGAGGLKRFFLGSHNRELWVTPVTAPYFDLGRAAGGLTPVKRGGGLQTTSIRLESRAGKEYVLRSLDKDPSRSIPPSLKETVVVDIFQDQVTSINPYGAYVIPKMADAIGLYHTLPRLVYVPDDPRFGPFRSLVADQLMMFEDRPDDDMSDEPRYGHSDNVVSASRMYEYITDDNDNAVDQRAFVRARLFDMLISDWDRHRDQWRWASFDRETGSGKLFRPIPRDRDWAFNRMNGLFPSLARYFDPKFQDFEESYGYIKGLTKNGVEQDRRLTNALVEADWDAEARAIQDALTDSVIAAAVNDLPPQIYAVSGAEMIRKLIVRRDRLHEAADEYYRVLARIVDVVGSNKHERFEVRRVESGRTEVLVYKTSKGGDVRREIYRRTFLSGETKELRLYGLDGNDTFVFDGAADGVMVRCIGGTGSDRFHAADGSGAVVRFYDTTSGNIIQPSAKSRTHLSDDPFDTSYNPREFQHNVVIPQAFFGSNPDDGIFVGGGAKFVDHGFKKIPFAREQTVVANFAARTQAFNIVYAGRFVGALDSWDLLLDAAVLSPNNIRNFYGLGNRTRNVAEDREFYQARLTQARVAAGLSISSPLGARIEVGPFLRVTKVEQDEEGFVTVPQPGISESSFDDQWFAGARLMVEAASVDQPTNPRQGFRLTSSAEANLGIRNATDSYGSISSDLSVYISPSLSPQLTFALRAGVEHNVGQFPFYAASALGGATNLRGYRSTRYAGRTAFYQNLELRASLLSFSTYLAGGNAGVLAFVDNGRVWTEAEASNRAWHQGYGGGLWAHLFDAVALSGVVGASKDEVTFTLKLGFQY